MATKKLKAKPAVALPEFKRVPIGLVQEPKLPARATMSDSKMQELIASLKAVGQIEPITVEDRGGQYEIVTGHRRYLAARSIGWTEISAMVYPKGAAHSMARMLHENIVREDLNPAEEALLMKQAQDEMQLDEQGLCDLFQRPANYIANRFALLRGDPKVFESLQRGEIRIGVAHELNRIADDGMRAYYLDVARRSDPLQRTVHQWVNDYMLQEQAARARPAAAAAAAEENGNGLGAIGEGVAPGGVADASGAAIPQPFFGCDLCGGARDPYNLVTKRIHKWEWEQIESQVAKAARGE